jgi:undecaprenyl-diphosphatase
MLLLTGVILFLTRWAKEKSTPIGWLNSFLIGLGQAFAILPGVSRSGTTISLALFLGIEREKAARFSFLLSLPVIIGAALKQSLDMLNMQIELSGLIVPLIVSTAVAFISGYFAIIFLLGLVKKGRFSYFAYYCWAVGLLSLILL